ncbi:MAG: endo alpha-1,4 polygalactosaminidase, partial [Flavitalea sp.]
MKFVVLLAIIALPFTGCNKDDGSTDTVNPVDPTPLPSDKTTWWKPAAGVSFDWQLDDLQNGEIFTAEVVDVDAFTTTAEQVAALHAQGKKVIAYLS